MKTGGDPLLEIGDVTVDERDVSALRAIGEYGSMHRAAEELGRSYARIQQRVNELESELGPLLTRTRGGAGGGGSELTDEARELLARFDRLRAEFAGLARSEETVFAGRLVERDGLLGVVETDAGRLRATVLSDAEDVQVSVRSDAIGLTTPAEAPDPGKTSVRNQLRGTVTRVESDGGIARVTVDVGAESPLRTLVTETSLERLGLSEGDTVVASFKATATRAVPRSSSST